MFGIPLHSFYMSLLVLALLLIATTIRLTLKTRNPSKDYTELRLRIQSWWWMIGILFTVLLFNKTISIIFFAFLSFLTLKEYLSIVPTRFTDRRVIFWAYIAIPIQYYFISISWYGMFIIFIPVYIFLFLPMRMVLIGDTQGFLPSVGIMHWGVMLSVFCIGHIAYLLMLPNTNPSAGYMGPVLFLIFITQFNDVCQYTWGKMFGRHKIIPKVSPNKTWEGFVGGMITVTLTAAFVAPLLTPLNQLQGLCTGLLISAAGFIGDVVISSVKRDLKIKDSGALIPGHGGILDRLDSLLYTSPIFFHFFRFVTQ